MITAPALVARPPVEALVRAAAERPAAVAAGGVAGTITAGDLAAAAGGTAAALGRSGGPVLVVAADAVDLTVGLVAALAAGRPVVPVDPRLPPARVVGLAHRVGAEVVVADRGRAADLAGVAAGPRVVATGTSPARRLTCGVPDPDAVALLLPTAGTTGEPVLVPVTNRTILADAAEVVAAELVRPTDHLGRLRTASGSLAAAAVGALALGLPITVLDPRRAPGGRVLSAVAARGVTYLHLTPTLLRLLVRAERGSRPLAGLRLVGGGGEAMRWTDVAAVAPLLGPDSRVLHGYGATEVGAVARLVIDPARPHGRGVVPVGRPVPGRRVDVVVGTDAAGGRGAAAVGELLVTREDLGLGPVLTGDLGRRDADGVLHLVGRADRMVKVGGVRVEPAALEAALAEVDGVADAAVVAVPDEDVGVRLVAHVHVIARPGADAGRLTAHVRALGLPGADGLRVVRRDAPLPLLASGKPDLRHLAAG